MELNAINVRVEGRKEPLKRKQLKQLFVILDCFNRDALYRQCGKVIDFKEKANRFCTTLNQIQNPDDINIEMEFSDYKTGIEKGDPPLLQQNYFKSAKVRSTLLFFAVSQPIPTDEIERNCLLTIIKALVEKCPDAVTFPWNVNRYDLTPLHLMVVKEANLTSEKDFKRETLQTMLDAKEWDYLLDAKDLKSKMFRGSISGGKSLLNIAARTLDKETIKLLLTDRVRFFSCNAQGDNMYHSLIRYACICPEKEMKIMSTMTSIAKILCDIRSASNIAETDYLDEENMILKMYPDYLWMMTNKEGLTPLQLAAKLGRFELFKFISQQKIYQINDGDRGSLDDVAYDVTEIDTVPVTGAENACNSVLHLLHQKNSDELTLRFVDLNVVAKTIFAKWKVYKFRYLILSFLHFVMMCLYSSHAIIRSRLENPVHTAESMWSNLNDVAYVITTGTITSLYGILCVVSPCLVGINHGTMHRGLRYFWKHRHAAVFFSHGHIILLLGLCMILDFALMFTTSRYHNYVLPFAVIIGWYITIYSLRVFEQFSFFTVLIKNVISDLIQFGIIMSLLLIGFSVAMFVAMQGAEGLDETHFHNIGKTFVKMFTVMVGIGEIDVLFSARDPIMAVIVFILFVLLTSILLFNALIAIVSNTCSALTTPKSGKSYVLLQRLHAMINLESMFLNWFLSPAAEEILRIRPPVKARDVPFSRRDVAALPRRILWIQPDDDEQSTHTTGVTFLNDICVTDV